MSQSGFWFQFGCYGFIHNPTAPVKSEFGRLASKMGWTKGSLEHRKNWVVCISLELEYDLSFEGKKLADWHVLCEILGIQPAPPSIRKSKMITQSFPCKSVCLLGRDIDGNGEMVNIMLSSSF
jgi:hypothetical protein